MKGEIEAMQPQAKKCLEPLETGRGKERFSPRYFRENMALDFRHLASITIRQSILFV